MTREDYHDNRNWHPLQYLTCPKRMHLHTTVNTPGSTSPL